MTRVPGPPTRAISRQSSSITAGGIRRGYLKGIGLAKGCKPPAAPTPYVGPPIKLRDPSTPKYPIKK